MKHRNPASRTLGSAVAFAAALCTMGFPVAHAQTAAPAGSEDPQNSEPPIQALPAPAPGTLPDDAAGLPASSGQPGVALEAQADAAAQEIMAAEEQAAIAELMGGGDAEEPSLVDEYSLFFYGFADFMYSHYLGEVDGLFNPYPFFAVGRLNLYFGSELGDNWRTLFETRFTYLPHGSRNVADLFDPEAPIVNNNYADYVDLDRPIRWGGTVIERAWLEKTVEPWLNIRVGHWLTPYGIWNVDHGSPVILGVRRPFIVGEALLPESQTGIQLHGTLSSGRLQVGYHLTASNGRGPVDVYRDFDNNKAVGWRLRASYDSPYGMVTLGTSGYLGKFTARENLQFGQTEAIVTQRYDELAIAGDLKWEWDGFLLQSEMILSEVAQHDLVRPYVAGIAGNGYAADTRGFGLYALTGYRLPWWGIMPWIGWEHYGDPEPGAETSQAVWGGLNIRPTPRVVLKVQYTYSYFPEAPQNSFFTDAHFNNLDFQAAWSF